MAFKHSELQSLVKAGLKPYVKDGKVFTRVAPQPGFIPERKTPLKEEVKELKDKEPRVK